MSLMISCGNELIRYNPSNGKIEYSTSQGRVWSTRCFGSNIGRVTCLIDLGKEFLLCSDKGVFYSTSQGRVWSNRTTAYKNFIEMQDMGKEILASTDDGHIYYSTSAGRVWSRRK